MSKLALCFITCNRAKNIAEDLHYITKEASTFGIDIYIFDGSTNIKTENAVKKYIDMGFQNIYYRHYEERDVSLNVIERGKDIFTIPKADYIWLCGDKFLVSPRNYQLILNYINQGYDIITVYDRYINGTKFFSDPTGFVEYSLTPLTQFGSTIIKKELIVKYNIENIINDKPSFAFMYIYMCAIDIKKFKGITLHINSNCLLIRSKYNVSSRCKQYMWETWIKNWYNIATNLPKRYKKIQPIIMKKINEETGFFSLKELMRQRATKQFDLRKCIEFKKYIKATVPRSIIGICFIALLPSKVANDIYVFMNRA